MSIHKDDIPALNCMVYMILSSVDQGLFSWVKLGKLGVRNEAWSEITLFNDELKPDELGRNQKWKRGIDPFCGISKS